MTKILFKHLERCHRVLISQSMWSEEPDMTNVLFKHLEKCHRVLISLKHVV